MRPTIGEYARWLWAFPMKFELLLFLFMILVILMALTACNEQASTPAPQPPAKTEWKLTLVFSCDPVDGCGEPATVSVGTYKTEEDCKASGSRWLDPKANPTNAVKTVTCT